jgi:lipopolysaccharide biosynthesis regulator YciM
LIAARQGLGALRVQQRRFAEAEALLASVAREWLKKPLPASLKARRAFLWLGRSLAGQGRRGEAVAAWREGLAIDPSLQDDVARRLLAELNAAEAAPE